MHKYQKETEQFMESISTDFYLDLSSYEKFIDETFESTTLTITQLMKIVEAAVLREANPLKTIRNELKIDSIRGVVTYRIGMCPDIELRDEAMSTVMEMESFTRDTVDVDWEELTRHKNKITQEYEYEYSLEYEASPAKSNKYDSNLDQDLKTRVKKRISSFL